MSRIPPTGKIPTGGLILDQAPPPVSTEHVTTFKSCSVGLYVRLTNNVCKGYRLLIQDPKENRQYILDFEQQLFDALKSDFDQFPQVGETVDENETG